MKQQKTGDMLKSRHVNISCSQRNGTTMQIGGIFSALGVQVDDAVTTKQ